MIEQMRTFMQRCSTQLLEPGGLGRKTVPVIQQFGPAECGAACLAMTLGYHRHVIPLEEVVAVLGSSRDGVTAKTMIDVAAQFGLLGRGVRIGDDDIDYLESGTILHWEFNHFVVLERVRKDFVDVVDPAHGRRTVGLAQFRRSFTGVAILFERAHSFQTRAKGESRLWQYLRALGRHRSAWGNILLASLLLQILGITLPAVTTALIDRVIPRNDRDTLVVLAVAVSTLTLFQVAIAYVRSHLILRLRTLFDLQMTTTFLAHLLSLPFDFFARRSTGDLLKRIDSNATIRDAMTTNLLGAVVDGLMVLVYLGLLLLLDFRIGILVVMIGVGHALIHFLGTPKQKELAAEGLMVQGRLTGFEVEMLQGVETLKASGAEPRALERWSNLFAASLNNSVRSGSFDNGLHAVSDALGTLSPLLILLVGTINVMNGQMTLGAMLGLNTLALGFLRPFAGLVGAATQLRLIGTYLDRIDDVFAQAPERSTVPLLAAGEFKGRVSGKGLSFRYSETGPLVLKDVSIDIAPGEFVAVVGASGSGKSSLARLILGLQKPSGGQIFYDGLPMETLNMHEMRRQIGTVLQSSFLFAGSIRQNITLADESISFAETVEAATKAGLHQDIGRMPLGYETLVGEAGSLLSGGQRQRVAIARALVRKPSLLIFDEATSSLDAIAERTVQEHLAGLSCTRIVIAHRLSSIIKADRIVVLEAGTVVECGSHAQLMSQKGPYARLFAAQIASGVDGSRPGFEEAGVRAMPS